MLKSTGVSILINSYNYEAYVGAAIESALAQTLDRVQVVVVDDGSTDRSQQIIQSYGDGIEQRCQDHQGQVAACRHGLDLARHDTAIFLDADDILDPEAARKLGMRV